MSRKVLMSFALITTLASASAQAQLLEILNTVKAATDTYNAVTSVVGKPSAPAPTTVQPATSNLTIPVGGAGDTTEEPKLGALSGAQKTSLEQKQSFCVNGNKITSFPYEGDYQGVALILSINGTERIIPLQSTDKNLEGHHSLWGGTVHLGQINGYQLKVSRLDPTLYSFEVSKSDGYKKSYMTKVC